MARGDHFPFWRPPAIAALFVAVPAALYFGANAQTARFDDPRHQARECAVAAEIARIVFSPDGNRAFLERGMRCGNLCGSGAGMTWRRDRGRWRPESYRAAWIS